MEVDKGLSVLVKGIDSAISALDIIVQIELTTNESKASKCRSTKDLAFLCLRFWEYERLKINCKLESNNVACIGLHSTGEWNKNKNISNDKR